MKRLPRLRLSSIAALSVILAVQAAGSLVSTEWQRRQAVEVTAPGLVKIPLPPATFDSSQPDLLDLRLIDASARELSYWVDYDASSRRQEMLAATPVILRPKIYHVQTVNAGTQLVVETGTREKLAGIDLQTPAPYFLKAAHVEVSPDGTEWQSVGTAQPLFRQFGAEQLRLLLAGQSTAFVRITIDDTRSRPIEVVGVRVLCVPVRPRPAELVPTTAQIVRRDEFAGETVLTVALEGANLPLAELGLDIRDPLYMRRISVAVREVHEAHELHAGLANESTIGISTVYRVALEGAPLHTQTNVTVEFPPTTRELLVHILNGDSPPLDITGIRASLHPVNLLFMAPAAGTYLLLSGNPQATAAHYDLAAFAGDLREADARPVAAGNSEAMPGYQPHDSGATFPEIPLSGAPIDPLAWPYRQAVQITQPGVQELELDPLALSLAATSFDDLRLVRDDHQVPYLIERPKLTRSLNLAATPDPDPKRPTVSRWRLHLPYANLPVRRMIFSSPTTLFQRQFRLYELRPVPEGPAREFNLATGPWSRSPEPGLSSRHTFEIVERPRTADIWIETDNGDNAPIELTDAQAVYPVTRLVFKVATAENLALAYGNRQAGAPQYDLTLVAAKLLTASRHVAQLTASASDASGAAHSNFLAAINGGFVFWAALAGVVIVLLIIVAKLLPKPPTGS